LEQFLIDEYHGGAELETAKRNLKAISKTLYDAALNRAISKETALALKMDWYGLQLDDKETALHLAWEKLSATNLRQFVDKKQMLDNIEAALLDFDRQPYKDYRHRRISPRKVMEFLKAPGKRGGRQYVGSDRNGKSLRPSWKVFRNSFAARFFGLDRTSLQHYLERAPKQKIVEDEIYQPSIIPQRSTVSRLLYYLCITPLTSASEPIWVREDGMGFNGVADAIKKAKARVTEEVGGK
jgi:hypothetical protein